MGAGLQYIELYEQCREMICGHSSDVMNAVRDEAFGRFKAGGFPTKKVERYKYTDIAKLFEPDYGLNLNRLQIPVDPYRTFSCDVPNLSTSLYFVVNDQFYAQALPSAHLPEGVDSFSASHLTPHGEIRVALRRENGRVIVETDIPADVNVS